MSILSGPVELLILLCLMASWTCDVVSCIRSYMQFVNVPAYYSVCTACCMFHCVDDLLVECFICLGVAAVLLLIVMVLFCVWVGLLSSHPGMISELIPVYSCLLHVFSVCG